MNTHNISRWLWPLQTYVSDVVSAACLGIFCGIGYHFAPSLAGVQDIAIYTNIATRADDLFHGIPNAVRAEYPPLATLLFWLAGTIQWSDYISAWTAVIALGGIAAWGYLRWTDKRSALVLACALPLSALILGQEMVFARFDIFVAIFLVLSVLAYQRGRILECSLFLTLAACVKIVPLIGFPFLLAAVPRRQWKDIALGVLWGVGITAFLSMLVLSWQGTIDNIVYMVTYHEDRGIQLESTWSSILLLFALGAMNHVPTGINHVSMVNLGVGSTTMAALSKFFVLGGLGALFLWSIYRKKSASFPTLLISALLWSLFATPILSPQYVVWVVPVILVSLMQKIVRGESHEAFGVTTILTILIAALTQWIFPYHYGELIQQTPQAVIILAGRNIALLALIFAYARFTDMTSPRLVLQSPDATRDRGFRFALDTVLFVVAVFLYVGIRPGLIPKITNVQYLENGTMHTAAPTMPLTVRDRDVSTFGVQTDILATESSQYRFWRIRQDDCLDSLNVNGTWLPAELTGFCEGRGPGRVFDFSAYMHPGANSISAIVTNTGGPTGFDMTPVNSPLLTAIILLFWATIAWYALQVFLLLPALRDLLVRTFTRIGYTLQRLWTLLHSKTPTSSPASENLQMALSI